MRIISGFDVYGWAETQAFLKRLGFPVDLAIKSLTISLDEFQAHVSLVYVVKGKDVDSEEVYSGVATRFDEDDDKPSIVRVNRPP